MGPKKLQQSVDASIELENLRLAYAPGEVLHGAVKRVQVNDASQRVTVYLSLVGNIRTEVTKSNGSDKSRSHYYSKADFYRDKVCVYQGPVNHGINAWPFTIPINPIGRVEQEQMTATIPSTYNHQGWESVGPFMRREYLYCEYYLEAEIIDDAKPRHPVISTFPIFVRTPPVETDTVHQVMAATSCLQEVKTLQLDQRLAGQSLTFRQHMQSMFQRSSLPHYAYNITVGHATVLQIDCPQWIPLHVSASPDQRRTKTLSTLEKPPPLRLVSIEIQLQYSTRARHLEGSMRANDTESDWGDWSRMFWKVGPGENGYIIPYSQNNSHGVLDIGKELQMRITWNGLEHSAPPTASWKTTFQSPAQVWPSTDSHYIVIKHQVAWCMQVECAGKTRKIGGTTPITLLGPNQEWESNLANHLGPQNLLRAHKLWTEDMLKVPALSVGVSHHDDVNEEE